MLIRVLEAIGRYVLRKLNYTGEIVMLLIATFRQLNHPPRWKHVLRQMSHLGVDSLTIVSLTMLFTGMVLTLQIGHELLRFGAQNTIGGIVAIGIGRELGPVLVGVVCAGRVGAAITAEISTMKVTEQIDALRAAHGRVADETRHIKHVPFLIEKRAECALETQGLSDVFVGGQRERHQKRVGGGGVCTGQVDKVPFPHDAADRSLGRKGRHGSGLRRGRRGGFGRGRGGRFLLRFAGRKQ